MVLRWSLLTLLLFGLLPASWIGSAQAASTVIITGTISTFQAGLESAFSVGQPYSIEYTWQGLGVDVAPNPSTGSYYPRAGANLTFRTGSYEITAPDAAYEFFPGGNFAIVSATWLAATLPGTTLSGSAPLSDRNPYLIQLEFLPHPNSLEPAPYWVTPPSGKLTVGFATSVTSDVAFGAVFAYGTIDSVSAIPEPGSLALMLVGLAVLCRVTRPTRP